MASNLLEEYMKDIQGNGGNLLSTGPVRQDEPVSWLSYLFLLYYLFNTVITCWQVEASMSNCYWTNSLYP